MLETGAPVLEREIRIGHGTGASPSPWPASTPWRAAAAPSSGSAAVVLDVTERRRADELLMQSQRMEAVAKVAGGVAHEVNNMMTVITGFTGFLHETLEPGDAAHRRSRRDPQGRRPCGGHHPAAAGLQPAAGAAAPRRSSSALLLKAHLPVLERLVGDRDPGRAARVRPGVPLVRADPAQLEQVLVNLALNARDAMPAGESSTIEVAPAMLDEPGGRARTSAVPAGRYARIVVRDSGHGHGRGDPRPGLRALLHHQTSGRGHRTRPGDGLRHREAERRVHLVLQRAGPGHHVRDLPAGAPVRPCAALPSAGRQARAVQGGGETVLVVEDEEPVRRMAARTLSSRGYRVLEAGDAEQALASEPEWGPSTSW